MLWVLLASSKRSEKSIVNDFRNDYIKQNIVPHLKPGMLLIMDNAVIHRTKEVAKLVKETGATLLFLPPYSPDLTPIELAFSKVKRILRRMRETDPFKLFVNLKGALAMITESDAKSFFKHCGYGHCK